MSRLPREALTSRLRREASTPRALLVAPALVGGCSNPPPPPGTHHWFFFTSLDTAWNEECGVLGLDVDGLVSSGDESSCGESVADERSTCDPSVLGVDNLDVHRVAQLVISGRCAMIPDFACSSRLNAEAIARGEVGWVLEVAGRIDREGPVDAWFHRASFGGDPPVYDGGRLAVAPELELLSEAASAEITGGRIRVALASPIALEMDYGGDSGHPPSSPIDRFALSADVSAAGLTRGLAGGAVSTADTVDALVAMGWARGDAEAVLRGLSDLDPSPVDPDACGARSVALGFDAVPWAGPPF